MSIDTPTPSVSGRNGWEWNRWRAEIKARNQASNSTDSLASETKRLERNSRTRTPRRTGTSSINLRGRQAAASERQDGKTDLQSIIDRYERLLQDRERALAQEQSTRREDRSLYDLLTRTISDVIARY